MAKPKLLYISKGLEQHTTAGISFYSLNGDELSFGRNDYNPLHNAIIPANFDEMKGIPNKLANVIDSPLVRVDLYSINRHMYFSEITMLPCAGMLPFVPEQADMALGEMISL